MSASFVEKSVSKPGVTCLICAICDAPLLTADEDERPEAKKAEEEVSVTACGHVFHNGCLMEWLSRKETCPNCRHELSEDSVVPKLYFNSDSGEAANFQQQYSAQQSASDAGKSSNSNEDQPWYEKYKDELLVGGGALLGVIAGAVFTGLVSGSKHKKKN